ncbi:MAG TPA: GDSL-type esterase/lipase family protein [Caulobacteraceae bacterium]|nr:GDSL-type esterase/lipase family protein [Caulobacteraceae bacterium]
MTRAEKGATAWRPRLAYLADRITVLFMGVGVGAAITLAFAGDGSIRLDGVSRRAAERPAPIPAKAAPATPPAIDCAYPFPPRLLERLASGQPVTVGVFGDSFGDGVWAALYHKLGKANVRVLRLSEEGVGFTRYQSNNLEAKAADQLKAEPVDVAVIVIGANDTEGLFDDKHQHAYAMMSPGWKVVYGARIGRFVSLIRRQGAMVYWVGLPKMRQERYDQDVASLDDFYAATMAGLGVPFLSTRSLSADDEGRFNPYLTDLTSRKPRLMRANDGVHMTMAGYERLAGPLIDRIKAYIARAADQTTGEGTIVPVGAGRAS